jgi:hypothetical protein
LGRCLRRRLQVHPSNRRSHPARPHSHHLRQRPLRILRRSAAPGKRRIRRRHRRRLRRHAGRGRRRVRRDAARRCKQSEQPPRRLPDGSRVFFEAVPTGHSCSEPTNLYIRLNGGAEDAATIDLGAYKFIAANSAGTEVLVEKSSAETREFLLYDTETAQADSLFTIHEELGAPIVSADLNAIYFFSREQLPGTEAPPLTQEAGFTGSSDLYRYDILTRTLQFVVQNGGNSGAGFTGYSTSPDGRYLYWITAGIGGARANPEQVYRYDSAENLVQCMSCASPFDPEPKLPATFLERGVTLPTDGVPDRADASANGDYVFFDTPSALLPSDVDGEVAPECQRESCEHPSSVYSTSSDVYEWRRDGVDGCAHLKGCLALITSGRGGYKNMFLGTDPSGRDVFFATHESLVSQDIDTAGDVYDARIGGGEPPPAPRPVECEGDACSTPVAPPNDLTPSSSTFQGAGNLLGSTLQEVKAMPKPKKKKKAKTHKTKAKKKTKKKPQKAKKSSGRSQ